MTMQIVRLPVGKRASVDADCICVEEQVDATYKLTTSAFCIGADAAESVSIVGGPAYSSVEEAEAAGIAWAEEIGVEQLFVSTSTLQHPPELTEIDRTL